MRLAIIGLAGILASAVPAAAGPYQLLEAIGRNDLAAVRAELEAGTDPDAFTSEMAPGYAVYHAAEAGNAEMLALLVKFGADIDRRDHNGDRPLDWAARYGETQVVRLLVEAGSAVDPAPGEADANVPLVEALKGGHREAAAFLLDRGADPARADHFDDAPLHWAAARGDVAMAQRLLALGAGPAPRAYLDLETPLHKAAYYAGPDMIRFLLAAGAPVDARDWHGATPLFIAARLGRIEIVRALVEAGAAVDLPDDKGLTPLLAALTWRPVPDLGPVLDDPMVPSRVYAQDARGRLDGVDHAAVAALLAARTQDLDRAFAEAVWGGYGEVAELLVSRGALGQAVTVDGRPALAGSIHYPGMAMFERVAAAVTSLSFDGAATMVAAGSAGRMDIVRALLARRWLVDTRDPAGMTAFLAAAVAGRPEAVRQLAALGADTAARDEAGRDAPALMRQRLCGLAVMLAGRNRARALLPTQHIVDEMERLGTAYEEILGALGLAAIAPALRGLTEESCAGTL